MNQTSLSEQFLEENRSGDDPYTWLIVYDFIDFKPNPNFWKNLDKMIKRSGLRKIQYSVLIAETIGEAKAAEQLALHYGACVDVFRCEQVE